MFFAHFYYENLILFLTHIHFRLSIELGGKRPKFDMFLIQVVR
jgi:hypothetical protein